MGEKEFSNLLEKFMELGIKYGLNIIAALFVLAIGWWMIKMVMRVMKTNMDKSNLDESLKQFLQKLSGIILKVLLLISVASMVGIETTSFIAVLGAAGLAIGLSLQGSLANFAGGVLILVFRPFKIDDFIEAQGFLGSVEKIDIIYTILKTPHGQRIIIPNGALSNGSIKNFSAHAERRLDLIFGISYGDNIPAAKEILKSIYDNDARILKDPATVIGVQDLGDSSVNIIVKSWCNSADYWSLYHELQEKVKLTFDEKGISIPFPQRDVHLFNKS